MKRIFTVFVFLTYAIFSFARPVDVSRARLIAGNYLVYHTGSRIYKTAPDLQLAYKSVSVATGSNQVYFYVFNSGNGFVIISGDDAAIPVLGYSNDNAFRPENIPYSVAKWLENYKEQIRYIADNNIPATPEITQNWNVLLNGTPSGAPQASNTVSPLITTTWDQAPNYNAMCPFDNIKNKHAVSGCVATAMAQVLKFWNWPETGTGFHSYNDQTYGTQSASFGGTTYDWSSMPNSISSSNSAIATLMYHCGVSVNMTYGVDESSSYVISAQSPITNCAEYALRTYFDYKTSLSGIQRANYSDANWISTIEAELSAGRPVIYAGFGSGGGHCFVCDGFDASDKMHMNWGWGGYYNGYFEVSALNPGGIGTGGGSGGYNNSQQAVIGIEPAKNVITGDMRLYDYVTPSASAIYYGQSFSVTANVGNYGTTDFSGDFCTALFDNSNTFIDYVEVISGVTLKANSHYTSDLTFSNAGSYALLPGTYSIYFFYRPTGGDWSIVSDNGGYSNYAKFSVISKSDVELYDHPFIITPSSLVQGSPITVKFNVANYSTTQFTGDINVSLFNLDGTNAFGIQTLTGLSLNANSAYSSDLTFTNSSVKVDPGTYLLAVLYKPSTGNWTLSGTSHNLNIQNPIKVTIKAPPLTPDPYEKNNTIDSAYRFKADFVLDAAYIRTDSSNIHNNSDEDFYKVNLPAGYDYTIKANLDDQLYNPNGNTYTVDAVFSFSSDAGVHWSDTYGDFMPSTTIRGGKDVYFKVAPAFGGQTGTYVLEMNFSRTKSAVNFGQEPGAVVNIFPNPAAGILNIDLNETAINLQTVRLTDMAGHETVFESFDKGNTIKQIPVQNLPPGLYMIQLQTDKGIINRKITIAR
jgi:hypothetical protein